MKIEDLERITNHKTLSDHELLVEGAKGNIKLYTLIKDDIDIYFDLIEIQFALILAQNKSYPMKMTPNGVINEVPAKNYPFQP